VPCAAEALADAQLASLARMAFGIDSLRGARAVVDHRLSRRHLINEYHRGRLRLDQVCDAHPELIRAARNVGTPASMACPICREEKLYLVTYVFGSRLPSHGRCVSTAAELAKLNTRTDPLTAYVVEACTECRWHHLLRVLPIGGGIARTG
jgi:Family of unknown function (DUF5318)